LFGGNLGVRMRWIRFDEEDRWAPGPDFCLESAEDQQVCLSSYRASCCLVLAFIHSLDCPLCRDLLQGFVSHSDRYRREDALVLAVLPLTQGEAAASLASRPELRHPQIVYLADPHGQARRKYTDLVDASLIAPSDAALFILDSYGAPYAALAGPELDSPDVQYEALSWLSFIGMQCPE
jgi:peroxiredoxin